ncbi:Leucine rich repeat-containing protein [Lachnospiraceae bacterium]|nr:Leucine rich repeat-containing protein [Lachnospiraceae bacterium]
MKLRKEENKKLILLTILLFCVTFTTNVYAATDDQEIIDLYFIQGSDETGIGHGVPDEYPTSYQIQLGDIEGTPKYSVISGTNVKVSSDGLVTPELDSSVGIGTADRYIYKEGQSVVKVTCGSYSREYTFSTHDYTDIWMNEQLGSILEQIITPEMTQKQQAEAIIKYVTDNYEYSPKYASARKMQMYKMGDCIAESELVAYFCKLLGIKAGLRFVGLYGGAGLNHHNNIILCDGEYYIGQVGSYELTPEPGAFWIDDKGYIVQYDGFDSTLVIPEEINGTVIKGLGSSEPSKYENNKHAFFQNVSIENLTVPKTVEYIRPTVLTDSKVFKTVKVDPENNYYLSDNNCLYNKNKSILWAGSKSLTSYTAPDTLQIINSDAFEHGSLTSIKLNDGLREIDDNAFAFCKIEEIELPDTIKTIGKDILSYNPISSLKLPPLIKEIPDYGITNLELESLELPNGLEKLGRAAFSCSEIGTLSIPRTVTYINENAFLYGSIKSIMFEGTEEEWNAACTASGGTNGGLYKSTKLFFEPVRVEGITSDTKKVLIHARLGRGEKLDYTIFPDNASDKDVTITTTNSYVAYVSDDYVIGYDEGRCQVIVATADGNYKVVYDVAVHLTKYSLKVNGETLKKYEEDPISISAPEKDGYEFDYWNLSDNVVLKNGFTIYDNDVEFEMPAGNVTATAVYHMINVPTAEPTVTPCITPTLNPTSTTTIEPTETPGVTPTEESTAVPSITPTEEPTTVPDITPTKEPTSEPTGEPSSTPTPDDVYPTPTRIPTEVPELTPTDGPDETPTVEPAEIRCTEQPVVATPTKQPVVVTPTNQPVATPTAAPTSEAKKDNKTTFSIKNKAKVKASSKIKIKDKDKIKKITLNGKAVKVKTGKISFTLKLKSYKKKLKKDKWNKLVVTDANGNKKTLKFKIK